MDADYSSITTYKIKIEIQCYYQVRGYYNDKIKREENENRMTW